MTRTVPDTITRTTDLPHPIERVWSAITDPAEVGSWFADTASWELREGAAMTMTWSRYGTAPGVILAVEPMRRFAFRWGGDGQPLDAAHSTVVEWTLVPNAIGGTTLTVVESGFATLHNGPDQIVENTDGWTDQFENLARHLHG